MTVFSRTLLLALFLTTCQSPQTPLDEADPATDPFSIVLSRNPAEPDMPPALDGDTLEVRVTYSGGCSDHDFTLEQEARGDTTVFSIRHQAGGDSCEALVYDELRLPVGTSVTSSGPIVLRNPQGGVPFRLR